MRLFLIDKPGCHHITDLMPGIKSVYQLEQEFYPYLSVEFKPNRECPPGIILLAGKEVIRRNYTFDNPNDIKEVRKLIWKYLNKYHKIVDITDKEGCITDFRKTGTNKVIQGWQSKKRELSRDRCCKIIKDMVTKKISDQLIKHEMYRLSNKDSLDRGSCKKVRYQECGDNYPPNSALFDRCVTEVTWLCNNGYPHNKRTTVVTEYREQLKNEILKYLKENDMKVNKEILDTILSAGFFERVSNRVGNKFSDYNSVADAIDAVNSDYNYFSRLIEGYDAEIVTNHKYLLLFALIACVAIIITIYNTKN